MIILQSFKIITTNYSWLSQQINMFRLILVTLSFKIMSFRGDSIWIRVKLELLKVKFNLSWHNINKVDIFYNYLIYQFLSFL